MPRKLIKKYLPDPHQIKSNRFLKVFGSFIHDPQLWHLTRYSVSRAMIVGLFFAWVPVPFQMILAAGGAIIIRANLPMSVALVWITNPVTMPFLFGFAYFVGAGLLGIDPTGFEFQISWEWLKQNFANFWQPFVLGCAVCGVVSAFVGYFGMLLFWRLHIIKSWNLRREKRRK